MNSAQARIRTQDQGSQPRNQHTKVSMLTTWPVKPVSFNVLYLVSTGTIRQYIYKAVRGRRCGATWGSPELSLHQIHTPSFCLIHFQTFTPFRFLGFVRQKLQIFPTYQQWQTWLPIHVLQRAPSVNQFAAHRATMKPHSYWLKINTNYSLGGATIHFNKRCHKINSDITGFWL